MRKKRCTLFPFHQTVQLMELALLAGAATPSTTCGKGKETGVHRKKYKKVCKLSHTFIYYTLNYVIVIDHIIHYITSLRVSSL